MVKVSVEVPPARIGFGANCLEIDGGRRAVSDALATLAVVVPVSVVDSGPPTLECGPAVVAVTSILTVHAPLAGMVPPEKVSAVAPTAGAQVPPHVVAAAGAAATCTPAG